MIAPKKTIAVLIMIVALPLGYVGVFNDANIAPWPLDNATWTKELYSKVLFPHKVQFVVTCIVVQTMLSIISLFADNVRKSLVDAVVGLSVRDIFKGDVSVYRVTVYKRRSGIVCLYRHITGCLISNFRAHKKKKLILYYLRNIPSIWSNYLMCYSRNGHPNANGSTTKFKVPNTESEVDGFASLALYLQRPCKVSLPLLDVGRIQQYKNKEDIDDQELLQCVDAHLKEGKVGCFSRLKSMHRIPTHIWASPILGPSEEVWGVLVMDCVSTQDPFTMINAFEERIVTDVRIIERVLKY